VEISAAISGRPLSGGALSRFDYFSRQRCTDQRSLTLTELHGYARKLRHMEPHETSQCGLLSIFLFIRFNDVESTAFSEKSRENEAEKCWKAQT
jgi:hypothetical protein